MGIYKHSVSLDVSKCLGCTSCLKRCPTEAIRIRDGHACIDSKRCIDCGECIRVCQHNAKSAVSDPLSAIPQDKYTIAIPAPTLYGQFDNLEEIDTVLQGLLDYGFDDVYEVASAAELVTDYTRRYLKENAVVRPVISSACPVVTRLISLRFPLLCDHLLPILPPIEVAAREARARAKMQHPELDDSDICVVFISPCPAKVSYVKNALEGKPSSVNLVVSISDIYFELLSKMKHNSSQSISTSGLIGISWASAGGESSALFNDRYLAADGIENIIHVLEAIDNGTIPDLEFVELNACPGGCVGGNMTVANPYIAKARLQSLRRYLPVAMNFAQEDDPLPDDVILQQVTTYTPVPSLSDNRTIAMEMMSDIEALFKKLPGIDCGSCGSPTCRAFATDVIKGNASAEDCVFLLREKLSSFLGTNRRKP